MDRPLIRLFHGQPLELRWWGWRSDTHTLRRQGWQVLADEYQDHERDANGICLAVKSPDNKVAISGRLWLERRILYEAMHGNYRDLTDILFHRGFDMQMYTAEDTVRAMPQIDLASFNAVQPIDVYAPLDIDMRTFRFRDFKLFQYDESAPKEIYVPQQSVSEMFDRILQLQFPEQQDIKKRLILPDAKPVLQAKILTLAA